MTDRADLTQVKKHLASAAATLSLWYMRLGDPYSTFGSASTELLAVVDGVIRDLQFARSALSGQLRAEEHERARQVDAMIAERRGEKCLHGEDARHRSSYGEPVYVGCGCECGACLTPELKAKEHVAGSGR